MSKLKYIFTILILLLSIGGVSAQDNNSNVNDETPEKSERRPNLLRELDLSPEQIAGIRRINQSSRQTLKAAHAKVRETRRSLDQAIYSETPDEAIIKERLKEFQEAQAEVAKIRTFNEYSIRKLLTPEQLVRFREMREKFAQTIKDRRENKQLPVRRRGFRRQ